MTLLIHEAARFAITAHAKQRRKYTDEAYIVHPMAVADLVTSVVHPNWRIARPSAMAEAMIAAAWLHDVVEDCGVSLNTIYDVFGTTVAILVGDMTHRFTAEAYPHMNRAQRKAAECERIGKTHPEAQTIKLADLIDNTITIVQHDKDFARVYLAEKKALLGVLIRGDETLMARAVKLVAEAMAVLT